MRRRNKLLIYSLLAGCGLSLYGTAVRADVQAGVNAWSSGDYAAAVAEWRKPAIDGDADAQFNMGQAYKLGRGVDVNLDIALDWYRRAAEQGHIQAADAYGHLLHYQRRVKEALPYLEASASRGEPRAQYLLATELFNGVDVEMDWVRAYALMSQSAASGMAAAERSLAQMNDYIPLEQRQQGLILASNLNPATATAPAPKVEAKREEKKVAVNMPPPPPPRKQEIKPPAEEFDENVLPPKAAAPAPAKVKKEPAPKANLAQLISASGQWQIQLGAFSDANGAKRQWTQVRAKVKSLSAATAAYSAAGKLTRLRAGYFTSRNGANTACAQVKAAGFDCIALPR